MDVGRASRKGLGRKRMRPKRDRKVFSRTANRSRVENSIVSNPMRGGTRL